MTPVATIGGFNIHASTNVVWALTSGVKPFKVDLELSLGDANALFNIAKNGTNDDFTLEIITEEAATNSTRKLSVGKLSVLGTGPSALPFTSVVTVADRRWRWERTHIRGIFNQRRRVGNKRQAQWNDPLLDDVNPEFRFNPMSLFSKRSKWDAELLLREVVARIDPKAIVLFERGSRDVFESINIENLEINEQGDSALFRAMSYMGGIDLYIDRIGQVRFYNTATGAEAEVVDAMGPEIVGGGLSEESDNRLLRPSEVHVFFTREVELRFDFQEENNPPPPTGSTIVLDNEEPLSVDNVLPIPDPSLEVKHVVRSPGGLTTENTGKHAQGTWIPIDDAFASWGNMQRVGAPMSHDFVQKAFIPENDMWSAIGLAGVLDPTADWSARAAVVQQHYRQTFRINQRWMDRILSLRTYMVSTVDQASGSRANSVVYSNYFYRNSVKSLLFGSGVQFWGSNVPGYLSGNLNSQKVPSITNKDRPSPARLSIVDEDQGIVRVNYLVDPLRLRDLILPSFVRVGTMPTENIHGDVKDPIAFDAVSDRTNIPALSPSHKLAFMLTAVPFGPNNKQQFQRVVVKPTDLDLHSIVPPKLRGGLLFSRGPIWEIYIGPGVETARIQYRDDRLDDIVSIFFNDGRNPPKVDDLVVNLEKSLGKNIGGAASLRTLAVAAAAKIYIKFADRAVGSQTGIINPELHPAGTAKTIIHVLDTNGVPTTEVTLPEVPPDLKITDLLDASTRGVILRLAQAKK